MDNDLVYEDENCKILYNLWDNGGDIGFRFYNKTAKNIYLNLGESFFILNGIAYNYYKDRVFTNSKNSGISISNNTTTSKSVTGINYFDLIQSNRISSTNSMGGMASSGFSVSYNEEKIICIPSLTSKLITEYSINFSVFRDCDLLRYPTKKQIKTKFFSKLNSPFVFSNRLEYTVGQSGNPEVFENEFYVTEITNYPENEMLEARAGEFCGEVSAVATEYFKSSSPDKFYIKYIKEQVSLLKH